jgi:hypothetical protein
MRSNSLLLLLSALPLLASTGCAKTVAYFKGDTPARYARMMEDAQRPDSRRLGISKLIQQKFAQRAPYTTRYQQIFETDDDPLVRAMALRALSVSRDTSASKLYVKALADSEMLVRLEGAKALTNMPDDAAIDALLKVLNAVQEDQDVRIAAAAALQHYQRRDVARALAALLDQRAFGLSYEARHSLRKITGVDYGYDNAAWLEYINDPSKPLV